MITNLCGPSKKEEIIVITNNIKIILCRKRNLNNFSNWFDIKIKVVCKVMIGFLNKETSLYV